MNKQMREIEDDNHTIADMSSIRRQRLLIPRSERSQADHRLHEATHPRSSRDFSEEIQSEEERWMVILGTLKAALSVGMVYVVVFGIAIALMVLAWNR